MTDDLLPCLFGRPLAANGTGVLYGEIYTIRLPAGSAALCLRGMWLQATLIFSIMLYKLVFQYLLREMSSAALVTLRYRHIPVLRPHKPLF